MSADFWAGYLSGAVGILIGNPLDLLKTRLQAGSIASVAPGATNSAPAALNWNFHRASVLVRGVWHLKPQRCMFAHSLPLS